MNLKTATYNSPGQQANLYSIDVKGGLNSVGLEPF